MRGNHRRLTGAIGAIAALAALTACASDDAVEAAPAAPAASASPTAPPVGEFCAAILAVDTASLESGGGGDEEGAEAEAEAETGATAAPEVSTEPTAEPTEAPADDSTDAEPTATAAPESVIAPASLHLPAGDLPSPDPSAAAEPGGPSEGGPSDEEIAAEKAKFDPLLAEIERTKPAALAAEVDTLIRLARQAFSTGDYSLFESEEWAAADAAVDEFMLAECGYEQLSVTGADYEFTGIPATAQAGPTGVTLTNEGEEFHVIVLARFNDGETLSVDELLALGEEGSMSKVTIVGESFAPPGATATAFFDLTPGRYVALCPIPKGAKPGVEGEPDGPPHFTEGMVEEFTVS